MIPKIILGLAVSYLIGSIPTAYIFGRILKGIDIRKAGSGNVGATNAFRVLGPLPGIIILLIDILKGAVAPWLVADYFLGHTNSVALRAFFGFSAIAGHNWTILLNFKGGKGVATTLGVFLGLSLKVATLRLILALGLGVWLLTFIIARMVSLASVITAISFPVFALIFRQSLELVVMGFVCSAFIIYRHKSNIIRILHKKEPRLKITGSPF